MEVVINSSNYEEEVLKSTKPVILEFHASWWGACSMLEPSIKELAKEHEDIKFAIVDVDDNMDLANEYRVSSIPALFAIKDGKVVNSLVGAESKEKILSLLD